MRSSNEDAVAVASFPDVLICAVADGSGGGENGIQASRRAIGAALAGLSKPGRDRTGTADVGVLLRQVFAQAHADVLALSSQAGHRCGSTLALALWMRGAEVIHLAHIGDSRAYRVRGNEIQRLTTDHTVAEGLIANRTVTREEVRQSPGTWQVLYRFLGADPFYGPEIGTVPLKAGDRFLLCTDGLTRVVPDEQLLNFLRSQPDVQQCADGLGRLALDCGARDNVSCIVIDVR
jgi:protein phosphatase